MIVFLCVIWVYSPFRAKIHWPIVWHKETNSLSLSQTLAYAARPQMWGKCITLCASFHCPHCAYPWRDGQAELTWVLVTYRDGLPTCRWLPIPVLTRHDVEQKCYISPFCTEAPPWMDLHHRLSDLITCAKFCIDRFRGFDSVGSQNFPFSID